MYLMIFLKINYVIDNDIMFELIMHL